MVLSRLRRSASSLWSGIFEYASGVGAFEGEGVVARAVASISLNEAMDKSLAFKILTAFSTVIPGLFGMMGERGGGPLFISC